MLRTSYARFASEKRCCAISEGRPCVAASFSSSAWVGRSAMSGGERGLEMVHRCEAVVVSWVVRAVDMVDMEAWKVEMSADRISWSEEGIWLRRRAVMSSMVGWRSVGRSEGWDFDGRVERVESRISVW